MMMWRGLRAGASAAGRPQRTAIRLLSSNEKVFPRNEQVPRTGQLRLLDLDGKPLGVMEAEAAHTLRAERQLDLVLLSEEVSPPLGRLVEPGASPLAKRVRAKPASLQRLQQRRKSANAPSNKEMPVKELRLTRSIGDHDLAIKLRRAEEFLAKRHPVMVTMRTKGQLKDAAAELLVLEKFVGRLAAQGHIVAVKESDLAARVLPAPKSSSKAKAASGALRAAPASAPVASSEAAAATAGGPRSVSDADAVADVLRGTAAGNISGAP